MNILPRDSNQCFKSGSISQQVMVVVDSPQPSNARIIADITLDQQSTSSLHKPTFMLVTVLSLLRLCINFFLENVSIVKEDVILLASTLTSTAICAQFQCKLLMFNTMTEKLSLIDQHPAYFLLKTAFQCQN